MVLSSSFRKLVIVREGSSIILRLDLDKTYLVSEFDSLAELLRVPFEKAEDKVAVPGVVPLVKAVYRHAEQRGENPRIYFLSASPPQIGGAIREKLKLDGIPYDDIVFKNQVRHLIRGRFDALREQIGYKLSRLLESAQTIPAGSREYLFGDDWESDPFIYSLYADVIAGNVTYEVVMKVFERAGVTDHYVDAARSALAALTNHPPKFRVGGIYVLRRKKTRSAKLGAFVPPLAWFDNYFECSLHLYAKGLLPDNDVVDIACDVDLGPDRLAESFDAAARRGAVDRGILSPVRRRLVASGLMSRVAAGGVFARTLGAVGRWRRHNHGHGRRLPGTVPDYAALVDQWTYRARKDLGDVET